MGERIALGLGDNIDYEITWDRGVIEELISQYDIQAHELSTDGEINSERDLVISILAFLKSSTGGERFVVSPQAIEQFAARFEKKITLGGTPVRAAVAMRKLGHKSALHLVTTNEHVRRLIPHDSPYVSSNAEDTLYPHLIVQFQKDVSVQVSGVELRASRSNRIIYHSDVDNIRMELNEAYGSLITNAEVFLISGFNAMQDRQLLGVRLAALRRIMDYLPDDAQVFYEDAGFYDRSFSHVIYRALEDRLDVVSLNEDELQTYLGRAVDLLDPGQIRDALVELHTVIPVPVLVVHTMRWALAYGETAGYYENALRGGTTMATTRFCYGDDFTAENYNEIAGLDPNAAGSAFCDMLSDLLGSHVRCVPVAHVDQSSATTVGLGDAFVGGFLPALLSSSNAWPMEQVHSCRS